MAQPSIALGVKVFYRTKKMENLLESIRDHPIDTVYVADDGHTEERQHLYERQYPFELVVLDLEYDAGAGYGRSRIVDEMHEDYLLLVDSDHRVVDIEPLVEILEARDDLGCAASLLYKENGQIQGNAHDFYEEDGALVRDIREEKPLQTVAGYPFVEFDFVPGVGLFRREALEEYSWDPEYVIGKDHLDLYVGHWHRTDWKFGVYPGICLIHDPGGSGDYLSFRLDTRKTWHGKRYFLNKWGYNQIIMRDHWKGMANDEGSVGAVVDSALSQIGGINVPVDLHRRFVDLHDVGMRGKAFLYHLLN